ncbi:hypothetical protein NQ318_010958 [Aromia moschata]|uniref:Uncharacterized protein n=1 Tax=Aromia moschata TaxID=1265417 RepID=A0AAV8YN04_9CUCU|nr:hypothetical protein NQ318_010958 [Aromia moschata]
MQSLTYQQAFYVAKKIYYVGLADRPAIQWCEADGHCLQSFRPTIWQTLALVLITGDIILAGFDDGQIRVCYVNMTSEERITMQITQVIKPHNKSLTVMSVNPSATILVSGGEDMTIFIFQLEKDEYADNFLIPIGFLPAPDVVTCITWHFANSYEVLVGCLHGKMMQPQFNVFKTYKSQIRRDIKIKEIQDRKAKKLAKKLEELERVKKENPGLEIDEDAFLADSESEEQLEPLHIPEVPNKILWLRYTENRTIWLSMGGFDAGYIYEYLIDQKDDTPYRFKMVDDADDIEISSYVYSRRKEYLIFAMEDGTIRVNRVNPHDFRDLSDYWTLAMHDNQNGLIPRMCFSNDERYFFSCGSDGNVFAYRFQPDDYVYSETIAPKHRISRPTGIKDVEPYTKLSLEETKIKAENDRVLKLANQRKAKVREILKNLKQRYARVLTRNAKLLPSQVIPREKLELDPRISEEVDKSFEDKLNLVKRKLAYDVEKSEVRMKKLLSHFTDPVDIHPFKLKGINDNDLYVLTIRQRQVLPEFFEMLDFVRNKVIAEQSKGRE